MSKLIHKVPREEFNTATKKFHELFNFKDQPYYQNNFMQFLGANDYWYDVGIKHIICSELALRKIEILNSPHAYALMKAFIARTGYHKKMVER